MHEALVLIAKHIFFPGYFLRKWNLTTVSLAQMGEIMVTPMFISASQNTVVKPLWC